MEIHFYCPATQEATQQVRCNETLGGQCTPEQRCGYCDDGWLETRILQEPRVFFEMSRAHKLLAMLTLPVEDEGELRPEEIPKILRRISGILVRETERALLTYEDAKVQEEAVEDGPATPQAGPRLVLRRPTDPALLQGIRSLRRLFLWATSQSLAVSWS